MRFWLVLCMALLLGAVGCGMPQAKLDEAQAALQNGLETWKKGGKPSELLTQTPPVEFHEAMWNSGEVLIRYEGIKTTYHDREKVIRCEVQLTVRNRRGKTRTETVVYDMQQGPPLKILNNPMP